MSYNSDMPSTSGPFATDPWKQDVQYLKGVGPSRAELLTRLDIRTVGDLLLHLPRSYDDLSNVRPIMELSAGTMQTVEGEVVEIEGKTLADGRTITSIVLADPAGKCLEGVWFNQPYVTRGYRFGQRLAFSGKPRWFREHWTMNNPRVQALDGAEGEKESNVVPIYPLTENLRLEQLRAMLRQAIDRFGTQVPEILPAEVLARRHLPGIAEALEAVHFPRELKDALAARGRFIYEEFLVLQVALALRRRELRDRQRAPKLPVDASVDKHIRRLFPFDLTADQDRAVAAVCRDLAKDRPMQRLLQADVGAGKTAVAVYALLVAVANKYQAILMAPTEVLAMQHWRTLERYLAHSRVRRLLLTGALNTRQRREALESIRNGDIDLVVGTQALVQEDVQFSRLGLVIIDEQHKFGVNQRARVRRLGVDPHYLVMTATPIPRTMALTVFGDLDVSVIRQLPPGRQSVRTKWLEEPQREKTLERLKNAMKDGRQVFFVCPLVEESETLDLKAAEKTYAELKEGPFREFRLGLLHGRLNDREKDEVMQQFRAHELDLLVTTMVIEVGVDVPNATVLVVEHADRFGLSQLHQLRGRVSRGKVAGECYLFAGATSNAEAKERLKVLTRTTDGFAVAEADARLRGLGQMLGTRQHGLGELRFGDLVQDQKILEAARDDAITLVSADAGLRRPEHAGLRQMVLRRYGTTLDLAEIG